MAEKETGFDRDLTLHWESIALRRGHAGASTRFLARERQVVHETWAIQKRLLFGSRTRKTSETLEIPPEVTTEAELRSYVRARRRTWLPRSRER